MREGNKLSAQFVRNVSKPGLYSDGHGLGLQVSKWGTKAWVFRYMRRGVPHKYGIGPLHTVDLKEARNRALKLRRQLLDDVDPLEERKTAKAAARVERAKLMTFRQCVDGFLADNEAAWSNETHRKQWRTTIEGTYPILGNLPVSAIDIDLVLRVLKPMWRETPETASRLRGRIEKVLSWATTHKLRSGDNPAAWSHLKTVLPSPRKLRAVEHLAALPYAEVPTFLAQVQRSPAIAAPALEFAVLTAGRRGEVLGAKWSEIDFEKKLWTIPAARMKAKVEHVVPLPDRALEILRNQPRISDYAFPGAKPGRPMSHLALTEALQTIRKDITVHGFRSSFRDWCAERTNYPREICEMALAHAVGNKVEQAYHRSKLVEQRRKLMDEWSRFCATTKPTTGSKVVALHEARS